MESAQVGFELGVTHIAGDVNPRNAKAPMFAVQLALHIEEGTIVSRFFRQRDFPIRYRARIAKWIRQRPDFESEVALQSIFRFGDLRPCEIVGRFRKYGMR